MAECPVCNGHGNFGDLDIQAMMSEHYSDSELREMGFEMVTEDTECEECEGTGVVTEERWLDLQASARAFMDQVIAQWEEHYKGKPYVPDRLTELLSRLEA